MSEIKMKFGAACMRFFGKKPGESLQQFAAELRALTKEDKAELAALLAVALGAEIETE